ncbi:MAG: DUF371 domain-containing protein [Nanoarchaeota archaeon]
MGYSFNCYGHENITARHKTTFEFTKDEGLSLNGDCIIGVRADFSPDKIKQFVKSLGNNKKITISIEPLDYNDEDSNNKTIIKQKKNIEKINCEINPDFNSGGEMVIRKGDFISERTLAVKADKAAFELDRGLIKFLQQPSSRIKVILNCEKE